ncbi:MAG TPA: DinB family protein [Dehalococcoidia bacterium]|nr:DinB family protein [Dehalococcoidia bacterium]
MTTQQEIVDGMQQLIVQARRVGRLLDDQGDWETKRPAGWTPREMYCHIAATGGMIAQMGPALLAAPEDADMTQSTSIGDLNAQTIASMQALTPEQLVAMVDTNYTKAAEWVQSIPDDQFQAPKTFAQMKMPASELISNIGVLHANHHLYEAALRVAF